MSTKTLTQMTVGAAIELESTRRINHTLIAIGACRQGQDHLAKGNGLSSNLDILGGAPKRGGKRRVETQRTLNKVDCQLRILLQSSQNFAPFMKYSGRRRDQTFSGLLTGDQ